MRARQAQRLGQRREREEEEQRQLDIEQAAATKRKADSVELMLKNAGNVDKKWRAENATREAKDLSTRVHTASLNYFTEYSRANPAPKTREHPHRYV